MRQYLERLLSFLKFPLTITTSSPHQIYINDHCSQNRSNRTNFLRQRLYKEQTILSIASDRSFVVLNACLTHYSP